MLNCEAGQKCILDIVTLTDFETSAENKVQVYISGCLHGNERLGPVVSYYFLEFLASSFGKDPYITELLKTREIVVTPMTNAIGYYENQRKEKTKSATGQEIYRDPNRDFPYNNRADSCMNTVASRAIYRLFAENLFVSAITFHGGDNVIAYCWGSNNHAITQ